jgi:hypothetical protein
VDLFVGINLSGISSCRRGEDSQNDSVVCHRTDENRSQAAMYPAPQYASVCSVFLNSDELFIQFTVGVAELFGVSVAYRRELVGIFQ